MGQGGSSASDPSALKVPVIITHDVSTTHAYTNSPTPSHFPWGSLEPLSSQLPSVTSLCPGSPKVPSTALSQRAVSPTCLDVGTCNVCTCSHTCRGDPGPVHAQTVPRQDSSERHFPSVLNLFLPLGHDSLLKDWCILYTDKDAWVPFRPVSSFAPLTPSLATTSRSGSSGLCRESVFAGIQLLVVSLDAHWVPPYSGVDDWCSLVMGKVRVNSNDSTPTCSCRCTFSQSFSS